MVGAPLCAHHTPPINLRQYSTLHPHPCTHSEPSCTATFGCAHPTMFPIAWRNFHHKPALVASVILWLEYLLCAHHLPSTSSNIPHCTRTHSEPGCTATLGHACPSMFPIAWRNFHHKPALVAPFILWLEYLLCAHHTHFPIFQLPGTHVDRLFANLAPSWLAHHLAHPSVHLCTPLHTFAHPCAPLCFTFPGLVTLI